VAIAAAGVARGAPVRIDCSGVAFLDASGSQTLVRAASEVAPLHPLVVVEPGPAVGHVIRSLARQTPSLTVVSDEAPLARAS
jgi:anti-anti-sigma regulatory factor